MTTLRSDEWPGARKFRNKPLSNVDLLEEEFGNVYVSGAEGWSAQQGETSLDSRTGDQRNDEFDSTDTDVQAPMEETQNRPMRPRASRKRKVGEMIAESSASRDALLTRKNDMLERILGGHPDYKFNVTCALKVLNEMPGVIMWSAFYVASMDHLMADTTHRQAFLTFSTSEDRIRYLEYKTGKKCDE